MKKSLSIKELIGASVSRVEEGGRLVDAAGDTMQRIVASVHKVAGIMGEIASASQQQGSGIGEVNQAIGQMDTMTQQNAALVEQATAESLQEQAQALAQAVSIFRLKGASTAMPARPATPAHLPVPRVVRNPDEQRQSPRATGPARAKARPATSARNSAPASDEWEEH